MGVGVGVGVYFAVCVCVFVCVCISRQVQKRFQMVDSTNAQDLSTSALLSRRAHCLSLGVHTVSLAHTPDRRHDTRSCAIEAALSSSLGVHTVSLYACILSLWYTLSLGLLIKNIILLFCRNFPESMQRIERKSNFHTCRLLNSQKWSLRKRTEYKTPN